MNVRITPGTQKSQSEMSLLKARMVRPFFFAFVEMIIGNLPGNFHSQSTHFLTRKKKIKRKIKKSRKYSIGYIADNSFIVVV